MFLELGPFLFAVSAQKGIEPEVLLSVGCSLPPPFLSLVSLTDSIATGRMEAELSQHGHKEDREEGGIRGEEVEEEYVLLDLDAVPGHVVIPPNAPYVLSGLDTLNPTLIIDDKLKLIGEYEETVGTCLVFSENEAPVVHEETGPSEANLFSGRRIIDTNQAPTKQVKPVCKLQKILKFRLSPDDDAPEAAKK